MPTGYTAKLVEKGQEFPEFVMTCARAMGACVMMRDEPMDAVIPEKFEPSDYHAKALQVASDEIFRLRAMSKEEAEAFGQGRKDAEIESCQKGLERQVAENARITEMESKVKGWVPPSVDHNGLKEFMLQQLDVSRSGSDYYSEALVKSKNKAPVSFFVEAMQQAEKDVIYHTDKNLGEIERAEKRTEWIKLLRGSIAH